jgi:L-serine dehydratase
MESIKEIYRIGNGPSSSHTMGPRKAAEIFKSKYPNAKLFNITLFGSLAATGKGHQTDIALADALNPAELTIDWKPETFLTKHPTALQLKAYDDSKKLLGEWTVYSVGGGKITDFESDESESKVYDLTTMKDLISWSKKSGRSFWEYVELTEGKEIYDYLRDVWSIMQDSIKRGIDSEGILPGGLGLARKASSYFVRAKNFSGSLKEKTLIFSSLAVTEENTSSGKIVNAPTCGSSGVVPAVLKYLQDSFTFLMKRFYVQLRV